MMLPRKEEVEERIPATQAIETGIFNHPVVVLSRQVRHGNVAVFVVSSHSLDYGISRCKTLLIHAARLQVLIIHLSRNAIATLPEDNPISQYDQPATQTIALPSLSHTERP
jgi:hypothetical protein